MSQHDLSAETEILIDLDIEDQCLFQNIETISQLQIGDKLRWDEDRKLLLIDRRVFRDIRRQLDQFTRYQMLEKVEVTMTNILAKTKTQPQLVTKVKEAIQGLRRMNQTYQHFDPLFQKIQYWETSIIHYSYQGKSNNSATSPFLFNTDKKTTYTSNLASFLTSPIKQIPVLPPPPQDNNNSLSKIELD
tara:strand:+ start:624 stop:1190 length:567 start_codon:yes stop_codon:yes gene_type:complete